MTSPLQPAFWDAEAQYAWAEFAPLLLRILFNGAQSGAGLLPSGMDVLVDWDVFNQNAINWINEWGSKILNDIVGTTQTQTIKALSDWIRGGEPLDVLEARLGPIVGEARAQMISTTEVTRLYAEGNLMAWKATGLVSAKRWQTSMDERVCFPAWTLVTTKNGEIPIQFIKPGNLVWTRKGWKAVKAVSARAYSGAMREIKTDKAQVIATRDHPIWVSKKSWLQIGDVSIGDSIYLVNNEISEIVTVRDFFFGKAQNTPTMVEQISIFPGVSFGVLMPISTINFQSDAEFCQKEINRIPAHSSFLDKFNIQLSKNQAYRFLNRCLTLRFMVARKGAKLPVSVTGHNPELFTAGHARNNNRRAAAFFRAIMSVQMFFRSKEFATPFANHIFGLSRSAFTTAYCIAISNFGIYLKGLSALRTNLRNHYRGISNVITSTRAIFATLGSKIRGKIKLPSTDSTIESFSVTLSFVRSKFHLLISQRHIAQSLIRLGILYHQMFAKSMMVYNLEIEEEHEFFANGVLVHNCPVCGPLQGKVVSIDGGWTMDEEGNVVEGLGITAPPAHARCRCWLQPVVTEEGFREALRKTLNG